MRKSLERDVHALPWEKIEKFDLTTTQRRVLERLIKEKRTIRGIASSMKMHDKRGATFDGMSETGVRQTVYRALASIAIQMLRT